MPSLELPRYAQVVNNAVRHTVPETRAEQAGLLVSVLFTTPAETLEALHAAASLAADLDARINLVSVRVVPYPLPLDRPPVYVEFLARQLRAVAAQSPLPVEIHLYFGRDAVETLNSVLPPDSLLLAGRRRGWRANIAKRLAGRLRQKGHHVLFADRTGHAQRTIRTMGNTLRHPFVKELAHP